MYVVCLLFYTIGDYNNLILICSLYEVHHFGRSNYNRRFWKMLGIAGYNIAIFFR